MNTRSIVCGAGIIASILADGTAWSQEALPAIDIGAERPARGKNDKRPGGADAFGNLPGETYVTPESSTATKTSTPLKDLPQSVKVITPQLLADQGPQLRTYDLAKSVSGVIGNPAGSNTVANQPYYVIRGFANNGRILVDGIERGNNYTTADFFDVDHVEFVKGPSSTMYGVAGGAGAGYGGIVNYVTKRPTDKFFVDVSQSYGSFDFKRTTLDLNRPLREDKSLLFRLNMAFEDKEGFVRHDYQNAFWVAPSLTYYLDNGDELSFKGQYGLTRGRFNATGRQPFAVFLLLPRERFMGDVRDKTQTNRLTGALRYEHKLEENWKITAIADFERQQTTLLGSVLGFDGASTIAEDGFNVHLPQFFEALHGEVDLSGKFHTGPVEHEMLLGLYRSNSWTKSLYTAAFRNMTFLDIFNPVYSNLPCKFAGGGCPADASFHDTFNSSRGAGYVQDLFRVTNYFRFLIGGRYDLYTGKGESRGYFNDGTGFSFVPEESVKYFSPHAGVVFEPFEDTSLFAGWGRSVNPQFAKLRPGVAAPPEFAEQWDVGIKQQLLDGRVQAGVTAFDITRRNLLVGDPTDPTGQTNLLVGKYQSHGLEFELSGEVLPGLRVNAAATFMHGAAGKDLNNPTFEGSELTYAPRRFYNLSAVYSFKDGDLKGLEVGANYYYSSKVPALFPNNPQYNYGLLLNGGNGVNQYPFTIAPIYDLGLIASYAFDNWKLQVNVDNLFDRANWKSDSGLLTHAVPRSIFARLSYRFE